MAYWACCRPLLSRIRMVEWMPRQGVFCVFFSFFLYEDTQVVPKQLHLPNWSLTAKRTASIIIFLHWIGLLNCSEGLQFSSSCPSSCSVIPIQLSSFLILYKAKPLRCLYSVGRSYNALSCSRDTWSRQCMSCHLCIYSIITKNDQKPLSFWPLCSLGFWISSLLLNYLSKH